MAAGSLWCTRVGESAASDGDKGENRFSGHGGPTPFCDGGRPNSRASFSMDCGLRCKPSSLALCSSIGLGAPSWESCRFGCWHWHCEPAGSSKCGPQQGQNKWKARPCAHTRAIPHLPSFPKGAPLRRFSAATVVGAAALTGQATKSDDPKTGRIAGLAPALSLKIAVSPKTVLSMGHIKTAGPPPRQQ